MYLSVQVVAALREALRLPFILAQTNVPSGRCPTFAKAKAIAASTQTTPLRRYPVLPNRGEQLRALIKAKHRPIRAMPRLHFNVIDGCGFLLGRSFDVFLPTLKSCRQAEH